MEKIEYQNICNEIHHAAQNDSLVVFIGAGMSNNFGYPTWNGLVRQMYLELNGKNVAVRRSFSSDELLRIPQFLRKNDPDAYERIIRECFGRKSHKREKNPVLDEVMKLKPKHIITTNFDSLIEDYLDTQSEVFTKEHSIREGYAAVTKNHMPCRYALVARDADLLTANASHLLLKMHGDIEHMDAMVLCEEDYLNYSNSHVLMENFIKSLLINHTFLFVGYGVADSNLKLIMNWVEHVASKESDVASRRRKHILLYSNDKSMDEFEKQYFEEKQILVLECAALSKEKQKEPVQVFADERGKNLLRLLRAVTNQGKTEYSQWEELQKLLQQFKNRKTVHIWEVCTWLSQNHRQSSVYYTWKEGKRLFLADHVYEDRMFSLLVKTAKKNETSESILLARELLGKLGISRYGKYMQNQGYCVPASYDDTLEALCLTHDYKGLKAYICDDSVFTKVEQGYWSLYMDEGEKTEQTFEKLVQQDKVFPLYEQMQLIFNLRNLYELESKYDLDFSKFWYHLPKEEQRSVPLLDEYMSGCRNLYQSLGKEADRIRMKYSTTGYRRKESYCPSLKYEVHRTELLDFIRCMVLNGFYIAGLCSNTMSYEGLTETVISYVDTLLFLISPEIRRKQSWLQIKSWDIYLLIEFMDKKKTEDLLNKYHINNMPLQKECRMILRDSCVHLLERARDVLVDLNHTGHMVNRLVERAFVFVNLADWKKDEITPVIIKTFEYLEELLPKAKGRNVFVVDRNVLYSFLQKQFGQGNKDLIVQGARMLLHQTLHAFLDEDHDEAYSKTLDINMDQYRDGYFLCEILKDRCDERDLKLLADFWKCYVCYYRGHVGYGLIDMFILSDPDTREEMKDLIVTKIRGMNAEFLRYCLESGALDYNKTVEMQLVNCCERYGKLPEQQRKRMLQSASPLSHVLRLYQKGIIKNIGLYEKYKHLDAWFSFVCFPESFDFKDFDVEHWCTWLDVTPYREIAQGGNKKLLKKMFEKEIENGAGEDVKRIYYRVLE